MNLIPNYENLNVLEKILFFGKILVVILVIIYIITLIIKKQRRKKKIEQQPKEEFEELPILKDEPNESENIFNEENRLNTEETSIFEISEEESKIKENNENIIQQEKEIEEDILEPIIETSKEILPQEPVKVENKYSVNFERPSAPYQKNVLREMSLSQTSPIGINKREDNIVSKEEKILTHESETAFESPKKNIQFEELFEIPKEVENIEIEDINYQENGSFNNQNQEESSEKKEELVPETHVEDELEELDYEDDIERTRYEIEQEENAIISYKELMEKKDSIQTIDEEDAIISIEELLNKTNSKEQKEEEPKLYNITEEEGNDSFINELKQFRKDL